MDTIMVDLDGTCFDISRRKARCTIKGEIDWNCMHNGSIISDLDEPLGNASEDLRKVKGMFRIVYASGREEKARKGTILSLSKYNFPSGGLWLRPNGDIRPNHEIKEEFIKQYLITWKGIKPRKIVAAIDDATEDGVSAMYKRHGIKHFTSVDEFIKAKME